MNVVDSPSSSAASDNQTSPELSPPVCPDPSLKATSDQLLEIRKELMRLLDQQRKASAATAAVTIFETMQRSISKYLYGKLVFKTTFYGMVRLKTFQTLGNPTAKRRLPICGSRGRKPHLCCSLPKCVRPTRRLNSASTWTSSSMAWSSRYITHGDLWTSLKLPLATRSPTDSTDPSFLLVFISQF